jgi:hypothetical protein
VASDPTPQDPSRHWRVHAPPSETAERAAPAGRPSAAPPPGTSAARPADKSASPSASASFWKRHAPGVSGPDPRLPAVGGRWALSEWLVNRTSGRRCAGEGVLSLMQAGVSVGGRALGEERCSDHPSDARITEGSVKGRKIVFSSGECDYNGTVVGLPAVEMLGNVRCRVQGGSGDQLLTGTWRAARQ